MAEPIDWLELEFRIALLPPISRAAHLGGPAIHARRLVQIWRDSEMTDREIGEVSDDELTARRMAIDDDGGEAKAIDAELGIRTRIRAPARASNSVAPDPAFEPPERPQPSDSIDRWGDDDVPLSQAFRLLGAEAVARAIFRTALMSYNDYSNDPVHWPLPPLNDLLPELNDAVWEAVLEGELRIEATPYARDETGKDVRLVSLIELQRLRPDWGLSRLCQDGHDAFVKARVRRTSAELVVEAPVEPLVEPPKRRRWLQAEVRAVMKEIDQGYPEDARPPFSEIDAALEARLPGVTQKQKREALKYAPRLRLERGRPRLRKPPA